MNKFMLLALCAAMYAGANLEAVTVRFTSAGVTTAAEEVTPISDRTYSKSHVFMKGADCGTVHCVAIVELASNKAETVTFSKAQNWNYSTKDAPKVWKPLEGLTVNMAPNSTQTFQIAYNGGASDSFQVSTK